MCDFTDLPMFKTHHYIPTTTFLAGNGELLLIKYRPIIMVGPYNAIIKSGVTDLFIMRDSHYGRMCLSQLKPSELYILSFGKGLGLRPRPFTQLTT